MNSFFEDFHIAPSTRSIIRWSIAFDKRQRHNLSAPAFDFGLTDNVGGPVSAFYENIRVDSGSLPAACLHRRCNEIDHFQTGRSSARSSCGKIGRLGPFIRATEASY